MIICGCASAATFCACTSLAGGRPICLPALFVRAPRLSCIEGSFFFLANSPVFLNKVSWFVVYRPLHSMCVRFVCHPVRGTTPPLRLCDRAEIPVLYPAHLQCPPSIPSQNRVQSTPAPSPEIMATTDKRPLDVKAPQGARDWSGKDIIIRDKIISSMVEVFKRHGAATVDTP